MQVGKYRRYSGKTKNITFPNLQQYFLTISTIQQARIFIRKNQIRKALDIIHQTSPIYSKQQFTLLSNRFQSIQTQQSQGTISFKKYDLRINKINEDLLKLLIQVEENLHETSPFFSSIKEILINKYERRIHQKISGQLSISPQITQSKKGTSKERGATFKPLFHNNRSKEILQIYHEANGRLLIVGEPGSGKSTLLLQLATELLSSNNIRIPIILNLTTWNSKYPAFKNWLTEVISYELRVKKSIADQLTQNSKYFILLFDGLDEIHENHRKSFLTALNQFASGAQQKFVITSRIEEYEKTTNDPTVFGQIEVSGFSPEQLKNDLRRTQYDVSGSLALLNAMEERKSLQRILKTPFYFDMLKSLFSKGVKLSEMGIKGNHIGQIKHAIVHCFISNNVKDKRNKEYISFLAFMVSKDSLTYFDIPSIQYHWLLEEEYPYHLDSIQCVGIIYGLLSGVVWGIIIALVVVYFTDSFAKYSLFSIISAILMFSFLCGVLSSLFMGWIIRFIFSSLSEKFPGLKTITSNPMTREAYGPYGRFKDKYGFFYWFSFIQHLHLRHLLHKADKLPFKLISFLNRMVNQNILEDEDGKWKFRHKILQDYLANEYTKIQQGKRKSPNTMKY